MKKLKAELELAKAQLAQAKLDLEQARGTQTMLLLALKQIRDLSWHFGWKHSVAELNRREEI